MTRERLYRTEAIVIRRSDIGEADRLLTIYTPGGKLRVAARGIRKTTSKLAGHLELFTWTQLLLARGRTFDVVAQSQTLRPFRQLRDDLERIGWAYYIAELLDKMTHEGDENRPLFSLLVETLTALDELDDPLLQDLVVRRFELYLLGLLGYRPHLYRCARCQEELTSESDRLSPQSGGMLCPRCAPMEPLALPVTLSAFKLIRFFQREPLTSVLQLRVRPEVLREVEILLQALIRPHLERDLKSLAFLQAVRS